MPGPGALGAEDPAGAVGLEVFQFERVLASFAALMLLAPALLLARPLPADQARAHYLMKSLPATSAVLLVAQLGFWAVSFLHYRLRAELQMTTAAMVVAPRVLIFLGCCLTALCWAPARKIELPIRQCGLAAFSSVASAWFLAHGYEHSSPAARRVADLSIPCCTVILLSVLSYRNKGRWAGADSGPTEQPELEKRPSEQALLDDDSGDADAEPWDGQSVDTEPKEITPKAKSPVSKTEWKADMYEVKAPRHDSLPWSAFEASLLCATGVAVAMPAAAATSTGVACLCLHSMLDAITAVLQGACFLSRDTIQRSSAVDLLAVLAAQSSVSVCLSAAVPAQEFTQLAAHSGLLLCYAVAGCLALVSSVELVRRVGPLEASLLLAMSRWPLPLGQLGLSAVVIGPGVVLLARGLRTH